MKKLNSKGFGIIEGLLILVIIGLIGGVGYYVYKKNDKPNTPDEVLTRIDKDVNSQFSNADFEPESSWSAEFTPTGFVKVDGYDYKVSGAGKRISLAFGDTESGKNFDKPREDKKFILFKRTVPPARSVAEIKEFVKLKFSEYGLESSDSKTFIKGDTTCYVQNDPAELAGNDFNEPSNVVGIACADPQTLKETAEKYKPFVEALIKENTAVTASDLSVGPLTIKSEDSSGVIGASKTEGYDLAELVVSEKGYDEPTFLSKTIAIFYAKNGQWQFITQADDEFGFHCDAFRADEDARKAFYDQICYEYTGNKGQIRLDTNNRALQ